MEKMNVTLDEVEESTSNIRGVREIAKEEKDAYKDAVTKVSNGSKNDEKFNIIEIPITKITTVNRIRKEPFIEDLVESIKTNGLLVPIVVAPTANKDWFVLVDGLRRVQACARVGITQVPAIVNEHLSTPDVPIMEPLYNRKENYTIKEIIDYIEYLENSNKAIDPGTIEFMLKMNVGDFTKLKEVLDDKDETIIEKMLDEKITISQAFKKLESKRRKATKEEKNLEQVDKAYGNGDNALSDISMVGIEANEDEALTDDEIKSLAVSYTDIRDSELKTLEEELEEGKNLQGYEAHEQKVGEREVLPYELKNSVLDRDEMACQCCGCKGGEFRETFDIHHIVPVSLGGKDDPNNLVTLCLVCHKLVHLYARNELVVNIENKEDEDKDRFSKIVRFGNIIRKAMVKKGKKLKDFKKEDNAKSIGREDFSGKNKEAGK